MVVFESKKELLTKVTISETKSRDKLMNQVDKYEHKMIV